MKGFVCLLFCYLVNSEGVIGLRLLCYVALGRKKGIKLVEERVNGFFFLEEVI